MASEHAGVEGFKRLASQLQSISQVTEALTYRLLELEERLAATELTIESLKQTGGTSSNLPEDTELRLDDTEARLAQLESMLSGGYAQPSSQRHATAELASDTLFLDEASAPDDVPGTEIQAHFEEQDADLGAAIQLDSLDGFDQDEERLIA